MSTIETGISSLTQAAQNLTTTVNDKIADIDARVDEKRVEVDSFLANARPETRYVQEIHMEGSTDYFYPVWWRFPSSHHGISRLTIARNYSTNSDTRPLDPTRVHQAGLILEMEGNGHGWGGHANFLEIKRFHERYNSTASHVNHRAYCFAEVLDPNLPDTVYNQAGNGALGAHCQTFSGAYLRGGGLTYQIIKNWVGDVAYEFNDGLDRIEIATAVGAVSNVRWFTYPIHIDDILTPNGTVNAFERIVP